MDYPPKASAGDDVVIYLPHNSVTLYGNGSTDDKAIVSYAWRDKSDSASADVAVSVTVWLSPPEAILGMAT